MTDRMSRAGLEPGERFPAPAIAAPLGRTDKRTMAEPYEMSDDRARTTASGGAA
jgi:hypothetical protein